MTTNSNKSSSFSANYSVNEIAPACDGIPNFDTAAFCVAADAFDFWAGQHTAHQSDAAAKHPVTGTGTQVGTVTRTLATDAVGLRIDMALHRPDLDMRLAESLTAEALIREVLEHTVAEVHALPVRHRGHYLAQLSTRWFSDGTLDPLRFRVANLLAIYFAAMPTVGFATGLLEESPEDLTLLGWSNIYGDFVDVVTVFREPDEFIEAHTALALTIGAARSPGTFRGVRYLPLDDIYQARFYRPDGTWEPMPERSTVRSP